MFIEIKNRNNEVIIRGEYRDLLEAIEKNKYNLRNADLNGKCLRNIDLEGGILSFVDFRDCDLKYENKKR